MKPFSEPTRLITIFTATVLTVFGLEGAVFAQQNQSRQQRYREVAGRDAFLRRQAYSTDALITEVKRDRRLRQRYAKHFGIPEAQVVDFFKNALITYRLPQDRVVNNYGVTSNGRIYSVRTRLKKGTMVWATRSGLPVLKWACANPLTKNLPGTQVAARPRVARPQQVARRPVGPQPRGAISMPVLPPEGVGQAATPELAVPVPVAVDTSAIAAPPALTGGGIANIPPVASAPTPQISGPGGPGPAILLPLIPFIINRPRGGDDTSISGPGPDTTPPPGGIVTPPGTDVNPPPGGENPPPGGVNPPPGGENPPPGGENPPPGGENPPPGGENPPPGGENPPPGGENPPPVINPPGGENPPANAIPEPGTLALLAMAGLPVAIALRRRAKGE